ncbi:MAG: hypothetical protein SOS24_04210 [Clostridia bacterium]|nr:hypothetical protein [Clostridia bacterium]
MSYNSVIRADDPRAVVMLKENLEGFEGRQEYMQKVNDYYKANGTVVGCPGIDKETAVQLDGRVNEHQSTPYPGRFFKDNFAEINRLKSNIDRLENKPETMFKGWQFNKGEAVINLANNRLQLMFSEKPNDDERAVLKKNGFKWAPTAKAWQRPLDFKSMAAAERIDLIKPLDGRRISDLQPKQQKRNAPER